MRFIISASSTCVHSCADLDDCINDSYVLITAKEINEESDTILRQLVAEFGAYSKNYALAHKESWSTQSIERAKGSGKYPIDEYVQPYLINKNNKFTLEDVGSMVGGIFVKKANIGIIKSYLATLPGITVKETLRETKAADVFAQTIFLCDDYLTFFKPKQPKSKEQRFFEIAMRLPLELQMVLCNKLFGIAKDLIPVKNREEAFQDLTQHLCLAQESRVNL